MKIKKSVFNANHIDPKLSESEINEFKALYLFYYKKSLIVQKSVQTFQ